MQIKKKHYTVEHDMPTEVTFFSFAAPGTCEDAQIQFHTDQQRCSEQSVLWSISLPVLYG
jgi:hypothetical protein